MSVTIEREERSADVYVERGRGERIALELRERGWTGASKPWNPENDLLRFAIPPRRTDAEFVAALEAACPDLDLIALIGDGKIEATWRRSA